MEQEEWEVAGRIKCPVCAGSELVVFVGARGYISLRCPNCNRFVLYDLESMTARRYHAISYQVARCCW